MVLKRKESDVCAFTASSIITIIVVILVHTQREITSRSEALRVKMTSEEKVVFLQEELDVARQALSRCQAECSSTKKLLSRKVQKVPPHEE